MTNFQKTYSTRKDNVNSNQAFQLIACENIRFSSLFVAEDVSRRGTSATQ